MKIISPLKKKIYSNNINHKMNLKVDFSQANKIYKTPHIKTNHKEGIRKHNEIDIKFTQNSSKSNDLSKNVEFSIRIHEIIDLNP